MKNSILLKIIWSGVLAFVCSFSAVGQSVSIEEAARVALNFISKVSGGHEKEPLREVFQIIPIIDKQDTLYFAINLEPASFVLVSADKSARPIIGYSKNGFYDPNGGNPAFQAFMDPFREEMKVIKSRKSSKKNQNWAYWQKYLSNDAGSAAERSGGASVGPLLTTRWNQTMFYNDLCPADANIPLYPSSNYNGRVPAGCVAIAMAQVLRYYKYPNFGSDTYTYDAGGGYGMQSADFTKNYDWSQMPDALNAPNNEVAKLIKDCGVSVNMAYGPQGSTAFNTAIPYALDHFFGYDSPKHVPLINGEGLIMDELNHLRPVIYAGCNGFLGGGGCHCWVCDGYYIDDQGLPFFHMNWGWGGAEDGFFALNKLDTKDNGNYNFWHTATTRIIPRACFQAYSHTLGFLPIFNMETVNEITASATISNPSASPILFDAGTYIQLNPGTVINAGTVFSTKIEGCLTGNGSNFSGNENEGRAQPEKLVVPEGNEIYIRPNPFTASTTIAYTLPAAQEVNIQIFNTVGNLVAQPVRQQAQEAGQHEYTFDAGNLTTGVYFLVMQTGGQKTTKRLVLTQ
ncbi:MAG: thiol protease/hemagglutinin PrtT [Phycisphaerae bacterium]|nr:thiol protease/hemagglutinin PrtT [Saprospiraceae bacterium]